MAAWYTLFLSPPSPFLLINISGQMPQNISMCGFCFLCGEEKFLCDGNITEYTFMSVKISVLHSSVLLTYMKKF